MRLLEAAVSFKEGPIALLYRLDDPKALKSGPILKALEWVDTDTENKGFLPLLNLLGHNDLAKPVYKKPLISVLSNFYNMRFLLQTILEILHNTSLQSDEKMVLKWFFQIILLEKNEACDDDLVNNIVSAISTDGPLQTLLAWKSLNEQRAEEFEVDMDALVAMPATKRARIK